MRRRTLAVCVPAALLIASLAAAQFRQIGDTSIDAHLARPDSYDGLFHYCRAVYRPNPRGEGGSWLTDYPLAEIDLSIRLSELTKIAVSFEAPGKPRHLIVQSDERRAVSVPGHHHAGSGQAVLHQRRGRPAQDLPAEGRVPLGG